MSKSFTFNVGARSRRLSVVTDEYVYGKNLAVLLVDESASEIYTTVSINVPGVRLPKDEFIFKTYSENTGLLGAMLAAGIIETTGRSIPIGCDEPQPVCRLVAR